MKKLLTFYCRSGQWRKILLTMKLVFIFLLGSLMTVHASSYSQNSKLNLDLKKASIRSVLNEIEEQTNYYFFFNEEEFDVEKKVSVSLKDASVGHVLESILQNSGMEYDIVDNYVVIRKAGSKLTKSQQEQTVSGNVKDESGEALPGVAVIVKGTTTGTTTDIDGNFTLVVPAGAKALQFSFVGMKMQEVELTGQAVVNVVLVTDAIGLEEVVAVGYGTQKVANLTGAVTQVTADQIEMRTETNVLNSLQGMMSGVTILRNTGDLGSNVELQIRGRSSINTTPALVIIDGAPSSLEELGRVNSNDIESISVLKDGASAAIYGARAAGGVVLVTTKTGSEGALKVKVNARYGIAQPIGLPEFWDSWDVAQAQNHADINGGANPRHTPEQIEKFRNGAEPEPGPGASWWYYWNNTDWIKESLNLNMAQQEYNIQLSGGSKNIQTLTSLGYTDEDGLLGHTDDFYKRINIRNSTNFNISDVISLDTRVVYTRSHRQSMPSRDNNIWFSIYEAPQYFPIYAPESFTEEVGGQPRYADNGWYLNPVQAQREGGQFDGYKNTVQGNAQLSIDIAKGLKFIGRGVVEYRWQNSTTFNRSFNRWSLGKFVSIYNNPNNISESDEKATFSNYYATLNYKKLFADKHNLSLVAGFSEERDKYKGFSALRQRLLNNDLPSLNLGDAETMENNGWSSEYALQSFFGRLNYSYMDKYLAEFTIRRDGSSRFYKDRRWGNFPSVSLGWRISEENFMQNADFLDNLKVRASYGELGNQNGITLPNGRADNFGHFALLSVGGSYPFGQDASPAKAQSMTESALPATERSWETVISKNIGVDATLLNNRLSVTFDIYKKETEDILIGIPRPATLGIGAPATNAGSFEVKGWEAMASWREHIGELEYHVSFRIDDNKTKVTSFKGENTPGLGSNIIEGYAYGEYFGLSVDKIAQTPEDIDNAPDHSSIHGSRFSPGDIIYKDVSGPDGIPDGKVTYAHDIVPMGNTNPRFNYGANIDLKWRNFDLSLFFQGVGKRDYFLTGSIAQPFEWPWTKPANLYTDYWREDNTDAKYPKVRFQNNANFGTYNELVKHNTAYLRLKNLRVGYHVPKHIIDKIGIDKAYVYADGTNLLTISDFDILDPEINRSSGRFYPFTQTYSFGINIEF